MVSHYIKEAMEQMEDEDDDDDADVRLKRLSAMDPHQFACLIAGVPGFASDPQADRQDGLGIGRT